MSCRAPAFALSEGTYEKTKTPIKHLVVIFDENISFDHYFATYRHALTPGGEPKFIAAPETPAVRNDIFPLLQLPASKSAVTDTSSLPSRLTIVKDVEFPWTSRAPRRA